MRLLTLRAGCARSAERGKGDHRVDAVAIVSDEVRELIRRRGLDPARDTAGVRRLVEDVVADYDERSLRAALPPLPDAGHAVKQVLDEVAGFGPLQQYLDDPAVEEVWVNEPGKVFVARDGVNELTTTILTADEVSDLVERMLKASGRRVDLSSPLKHAIRRPSPSSAPRTGPCAGRARSHARRGESGARLAA